MSALYLKYLLLVALSLTSCGLIHAAARQYPFDAPQDYLAPAEQMPGWAATLRLHKQQQTQLLACADAGLECRGRLRSFNAMLAKAGGLTRDEKIQLVNFYINRSTYRNDRRQRLRDAAGKSVGVQRSSWTTLHDFLVRGGDCEDFATSKYFMLRQMGFAAAELKVVVVWEIRPQGYHALLAIKQPDGKIWLLDADNRIKKKSHAGYRYLYAMNELGVWDHRDAKDIR